ncbi:MAG: hypothetical protein GFH27_549283n201 [Chloroflexi bacterium AL-W]|nr:hypothetical protein [Chloroflexi bacterium AL-N1]NOK64678.1 hypothetical protein [Chloroflexi bacterium AL-N10]NOK75919.1 hypothetical protein [Chloroflexi bacterium AL-N5]NOK80322.1 hypothetical protein [Chloroflexi bacterium AL-W]NOK86835.1 hypothetical protein [Chloroflexi bacterium AL-N15]
MRALHIFIAIVISIIITSSIIWVAPNTRAADEPNVFLNTSEIAAIKAQVQAGNQPWKSGFDRLKKDADDALNNGPYSVTTNGGPNGGHNYRTEQPYCGWKRVDGKDPDCRDGKINPQADRQDYQYAIDVSAKVRDLGLAYALTDDERYAERAAYLIRVWAIDSNTRMEPRYTDGQSNIELSITMPGLFYGADLISTSSSWSDGEQQAFEQWVRDFMSSARSWTGSNNFEWWRLVTISAGGAFLDDAEILNYAFDRYEKVLPEHIGEDGQMIKELGRTKSLMYSLYSLNAMTQIAEIARHNGRNLYDYTSDGNSLKQALDFHSPYAIDQSSWGRQQIAPIEEKDVAHYEMAYSYFGDQAYLATIEEWGRPLYERRTMGLVSLTHAAQGGGIVINPPTDPDPTPEPDPSPEPTPEPDPTVFGLIDLAGITDGELVDRQLYIEAIVNGDNVDRVEFELLGPDGYVYTNTESSAPYALIGDDGETLFALNNLDLADGKYTLKAIAYDGEGNTSERMESFIILSEGIQRTYLPMVAQ